MSTRLAHFIREVRAEVAAARATGLSIGLVPTMGALHAGHGRLIEQARAGSGFLVVTIFVNPIQFNDPSDYSKYPKTLEHDLAFCAERAVDFVFAPALDEMYPREPQTFVDVRGVADEMEGRFRPGHFRGVATVVAKLFNIVQADRAWFGEKDAQQLAVIRRMVADLDFATEIIEAPTVREPDGLALSSRNQRLTPEQRRVSIALYEALNAARAAIESGETSAALIKERALQVFANYPEVTPEYLEIADPDGMTLVDAISGPVRVAGAIRVGNTRLIDNVLAGRKQP